MRKTQREEAEVHDAGFHGNLLFFILFEKIRIFLSRQDSLDRDSFENVESGAYQSRQLRDVSPSVVAIPLVVGASFGD